MSDATLPDIRSSSEAPASANGSGKSPSHGDSDTSLIQPERLNATEDTSGDGDGKADSKQRRKRTSPKDQSTLETEYKLNPKPNKAARAEIVEKVDLNEKEVQIWFQNRRQIQRRKQRPLLPHEIAAFGLGNLSALSSDPASGSVFNSSQSMERGLGSSQEDPVFNTQKKEVVDSEDLLESSHTEQVDEHVQGTNVDLVEEKTPASLPPSIPASSQELSGISGTESSSFSVQNVVKSFSSTPGYLANRWNTNSGSVSTPVSAQTTQFVTPTISNPIHPSSCPERLSFSDDSPRASQIRISMSLDGKAELTSSEPSPPRVQAPRPSSSGSVVPQKRMPGFQRSQSAFAFGSLSPISAAVSFPPRLHRGRSRDARSWQFACDAEARDELTTQAENESSGSAVAAISLLRSTSKSALKPNSNKRNAPAATQDVSAHGKKPKLGRAQSSLARLQSTEKGSRPSSSNGKIDLTHSPSGDSDKENWAPHEDGGKARRRPLPTGRSEKQQYAKRVLGDNFNPPQHLAHVGGGRNKKRKAANAAPKIFEDQENSKEVGAEVEKFMRGEVSPSKRGEFEGAQALLAMMGSWR